MVRPEPGSLEKDPTGWILKCSPNTLRPMLNLIWLGLLLVSLLVAGIPGQLPAINQGALGAAKSAVMDVALPLCGAMTLWLGMVRLAEKAGLIQLIAPFIPPLLVRLFSGVPPD